MPTMSSDDHFNCTTPPKSGTKSGSNHALLATPTPPIVSQTQNVDYELIDPSLITTLQVQLPNNNNEINNNTINRSNTIGNDINAVTASTSSPSILCCVISCCDPSFIPTTSNNCHGIHFNY